MPKILLVPTKAGSLVLAVKSICFMLSTSVHLTAQLPPLNPTVDAVLDTAATQGRFAFSHIDIPAGVRVRFTGGFPVQISCDGDATIRGRLDVDAIGSQGGPGAVTTGRGSSGQTAVFCTGQSFPPGHGQHAGLYGSALPFDLAGGSPGGVTAVGSAVFGTTQCNYTSFPGGGGGGTLVLEAAGRVDVFGRVSANGDAAGAFGDLSVGSGGSLLLRGLRGLTVHPGAVVQATAETNTENAYPPGVVRIDAYANTPELLGSVSPAPLTLEQPFLEETSPPTLGGIWQLRLAAPRGDGVFLAASFQPATITNAYGTVGIDIFNATTFALVLLPPTGHDPLGTFGLPVPNNPLLAGINLWVAGLNYFATGPQRYTNTIATTVQ